MVDDTPGPYRPRRAYRDEPDETAEPSTEPTTDPSRVDDAFDDEAPKPLYRDEVYGATEPTVAIPGRQATADDATAVRPKGSRNAESPAERATERVTERTDDQTQILSRARARAKSGQRPPVRRARDEDQTTILPRTATGARVRREDDDLLDEEPGSPTRNRTPLLIGAVAAVVILGLALGYTVLSLTRQSAAPGVPPSVPTGSTAPSGPSGSPSGPDPTALLTDAMLMSPQIASKVDAERTWKVQLTQKGQSADSPQPACLGGDPVEGQPIPQQSILRVLNSTGKNPPAILQQSDAYATPEEAGQAYAVAARALGGCTMAATYIDSGAVITGLGDQSVGLTLRVSDGAVSEYRAVVLARTGRVLDVVDVAQSDTAPGVDKVALATGDVLNTQCQPAGGTCATGVRVAAAAPPVGGDVLGFLATADLPPVGAAATTWVANKPATPDSDVLKGSGCERVDWAKEPATARAWRTYLLQDSASRFGLDEVVLTMKTPQDATKLADKVHDDWNECEDRQLTASVAKPKEFTTAGARNTPVAGWTTIVKQKSDATTSFRVGIAAAGPKVVFTFLNPQDKLDLTEDEFAAVTARAGQRATQVK